MDAMAAFAHPDAALASPESRTVLANPNTKPAVIDQVLKVPLPEPDVNMSPLKAADECVLTEDCIDQYLWSVYERARKVDTVKVQEQIKTTVKKNGKSRSVTKTVTKLVDEDFTWKDPHAAEKAGMSTAQYVIGGMELDCGAEAEICWRRAGCSTPGESSNGIGHRFILASHRS